MGVLEFFALLVAFGWGLPEVMGMMAGRIRCPLQQRSVPSFCRQQFDFESVPAKLLCFAAHWLRANSQRLQSALLIMANGSCGQRITVREDLMIGVESG